MPRIFVRRGCVDTYDRLREVFASEPDVQILWDRREEERRASARRRQADSARQERDRRRTERRKPYPQTWLTLDFVVTD
ncbi:MAG TPA: hypothetical protein VND92_04830 [Vicinamibacterales bacterium]|nr:hypothetical protein [Vicinamibacterales bacterium]